MSHNPDTAPIELPIRHIGGLGDGVAEYQGKPVFVPFTAAGDLVQIAITQTAKDHSRAQLQRIITPSPDRITPACQHFGQCGGCSLQHLAAAPYAEFKQGIVSRLVEQLGASPDAIGQMVPIGQGQRRRIELAVSVHKGEVTIGFFSAASHQLVAIEQCPVSEPALIGLLPAWREVIGQLKKPGKLRSIHLTLCEGGIDALLQLQDALPDTDRAMLAAFAKHHGLLRLSEQSDTAATIRSLYASGEVRVSFSGVQVELPAGAFLQATQAGQDALCERVCHYLKGCNRIADLYAGCGSYSFALSGSGAARVTAYEGAPEMVMAMQSAMMRHGLDDRISAEQHDLYREPIRADALRALDGIVINPPRNGALPQIREIAKAAIPRIAMVSCNPASFTRDAQHLLVHGYQLAEIVAVDQFYWSSHLELVALFIKR